VGFRSMQGMGRRVFLLGVRGRRTDGHAAHESLNCALASRVQSVLWHALSLAGDGAHQDDAASNFHVLVGLTGDEELATSVDAHDTVILLLSDIFEMAERDNTRVGAADVELAEVGNNLIHEPGGLGDVGNVGLDGDCIAAYGLDLLDNLLSSLGAVGVVYGDLGTTAGELQSHLLTNATAFLDMLEMPLLQFW
jgi:hypothetical protein